jgi:hypothetical protein
VQYRAALLPVHGSRHPPVLGADLQLELRIAFGFGAEYRQVDVHHELRRGVGRLRAVARCEDQFPRQRAFGCAPPGPFQHLDARICAALLVFP